MSQSTNDLNTPKTIVLIHGLSENSLVWEKWKLFFEEKGFKCYAPDYPYHAGSPSKLRETTNSKLRTLELKDVVRHYEQFLDSLKEGKPILIGHSMGGLIVQRLIESGRGSMGICITSAPPKGIITLKWSFIKSNFPTINFLKGNSLFMGSKKWFHYSIANALTREESDTEFERIVIPESRNIARSSITKQGRIDFKRDHSPLLFIAAKKDHIIPIELNKKNFKAYKSKNSKRDFKEFKDRSHAILIQNGWDQVAAYTLDWIMTI